MAYGVAVHLCLLEVEFQTDSVEHVVVHAVGKSTRFGYVATR